MNNILDVPYRGTGGSAKQILDKLHLLCDTADEVRSAANEKDLIVALELFEDLASMVVSLGIELEDMASDEEETMDP